MRIYCVFVLAFFFYMSWDRPSRSITNSLDDYQTPPPIELALPITPEVGTPGNRLPKLQPQATVLALPTIKANPIVKAVDLAIPLIKEFEGFRSEKYKDLDGRYVVGYGFANLGLATITLDEANRILYEKLVELDRKIRNRVDVKVTEHQVAALISFAYNIGEGNFARSKVLRQLNKGDVQGAADSFENWVHVRGTRFKGLERRRCTEKDLFLRT